MIEKHRIMVSIPRDLLGRIDSHCSESGETRSSYICHLVHDSLNLEERTLAIAQSVLNEYANRQLFGDDDCES